MWHQGPGTEAEPGLLRPPLPAALQAGGGQKGLGVRLMWVQTPATPYSSHDIQQHTNSVTFASHTHTHTHGREGGGHREPRIKYDVLGKVPGTQ